MNYKKLLEDAGWLDESGRLIPDSEDEVVWVHDESPDFYTSVYRALNQGPCMPLVESDLSMHFKRHHLRCRKRASWIALLARGPLRVYSPGGRYGSRKNFPTIGIDLSQLTKRSRDRETTLLIVPAGAITMWKDILKLFPDLSYVEFNTFNKDQVDVEDLVKYIIVLSAYNLDAKQYHNLDERELDIKEAVQGNTTRHIHVDRSTIATKSLNIRCPWAPLYGMAFHRVILDGAYRIRSTRSMQFKAMSSLDTQCRIAYSSTIFNNDYTDVSAILTFLQYQPWCNPSSFARYFLKAKRKPAGRRGSGARQAQLKHLRRACFKHTLDSVSVRRNKRETFEGEAIVDVKKLNYQKSKHSLDDIMGVIMIDYIYHTEQDAWMRTKEIWSKQRPSEDEEDDEEEE